MREPEALNMFYEAKETREKGLYAYAARVCLMSENLRYPISPEQVIRQFTLRLRNKEFASVEKAVELNIQTPEIVRYEKVIEKPPKDDKM